MVGEEIISGVPAFGLPKISSRVGFIFKPARSASSLKSIVAKIVSPWDTAADFSRSNVSAKECPLCTCMIPFLLIDNRDSQLHDLLAD